MRTVAGTWDRRGVLRLAAGGAALAAGSSAVAACGGGGKSGRGGFIGLLGGGGGAGGGAGTQAPAQDKMIFDLIREEGMRRYRAMEKEIRENGEKWLKEEAEMMKKLEESSAKDMKKSVVGSLTKWVPFSGGGEEEQPKLEGKEVAAK